MAVVEHLSGVTDCFVRLWPGDNHLENFPSSGLDVIVIEETYILSALIQQGRSVRHTKDGITRVGLSRRFALHLGLREGQSVSVTTYQGHIVAVKSLWVSPVSSDDWEILESSHIHLETELLNQTTIVQPGKSFVVHVGKGLPINLMATKMEPDGRVGRLQNSSEVIVQPNAVSDRLVVPAPKLVTSDEINDIETVGHSIDSVLRIVPSSQFEDNHFVCTYFSNLTEIPDTGYVRVTKYSMDGPSGDFPELIAKVRYEPQSRNSDMSCQNLYMPKGLAKSFGLSLGDRAQICSLQDIKHLPEPSSRQLKIYYSTEIDKATLIYTLQSRCPEMDVVNPGLVYDYPGVALSFEMSGGVTSSSTGAFRIDIRNETLFQGAQWVNQPDLLAFQQSNTSSFKAGALILDEFEGLSSSLGGMDGGKLKKAIVFGESGCGKSRGLSMLKEKMAEDYNIFSYILPCKPLIGKKVEVMKRTLMEAIIECRYRSPSILLLDDLDSICRSIPDDNLAASERNYILSVSKMVADLISSLTENAGGLVGIVSTAKSKQEIHPCLLPRRNQSFEKVFEEAIQVQHPNPEKRIAILMHHLSNHHGSTVRHLIQENSVKIARLTEGFFPQDLKRLSAKIAASATDLDAPELLSLIANSETLAMSDSTLKPIENARIYFSDIGGLEKVKQALIESVIWPGKYAKIYAKCPLRLRSGVLLYGAPGTGKTALVEALANETKFNFISVKGPELLSKYIGESEASVRKVFEKASKKNSGSGSGVRPTIIFFDEFDSLAPRRGHDSTGVTDRVVNQLLTQLDGVEGGPGGSQENVFVIAASSRPDLIDPALLRPGRIDNLLHCPLPDQTERIKIIRTLCEDGGFPLDDGPLEQIASQTPGFTGSDLQSLIYTARIKSVKDNSTLNAPKKQEGFMISAVESGSGCTYTYDNTRGTWLNTRQRDQHQTDRSAMNIGIQGVKSDTSKGLKICMDNLLSALKETKPSINPIDLKKYQRIYDKISRATPREESDTDLDDGASMVPGKKSTLA